MEFFEPKTLKNAEFLKNKYKNSIYFAGGTIINWKGKPNFNALISLQKLKLNKLKITAKKIKIGSFVSVQEILENKLLPPALTLAAKNFNSLNIRNAATIGGSICDKFFVSNILPILLCYNAKINYFFKNKKMIIPLIEWLSHKNGIIIEIIIDKLNRHILQRQERISEMDVSSIVTALGYESDKNKIKDIIIAVSGAESKTIQLCKTTKFLQKNISENISENEIKKIISQEIKFTENIKVSKRVKLNIIYSHLRDILKLI